MASIDAIAILFFLSLAIAGVVSIFFLSSVSRCGSLSFVPCATVAGLAGAIVTGVIVADFSPIPILNFTSAFLDFLFFFVPSIVSAFGSNIGCTVTDLSVKGDSALRRCSGLFVVSWMFKCNYFI